jgi:hypothetical protein
LRRPDLLETRALTVEEQQLLQEYLAEQELDAGQGGPVRH